MPNVPFLGLSVPFEGPCSKSSVHLLFFNVFITKHKADFMYSNPTHTYVLWDFKKMDSVEVKIDAIFTYFSYEYSENVYWHKFSYCLISPVFHKGWLIV